MAAMSETFPALSTAGSRAFSLGYIASFSPAGNEGGVGGYNWFRDLDDARACYEKMAAESKIDGQHVVRLIQVALPSGVEGGEMLDYIDDSHSDGIEDNYPALDQYVPAGAFYVPTGGVSPRP